jgi:type III secretory pathway component EscS
VVRAGIGGTGRAVGLLAAITEGGDAFLAFTVMVIVLFVALVLTVDK